MSFCCLLLGVFTFVQLNCENLFDCRHDSLKQDTEFMEDSPKHWTRTRYWRKLNSIGQEIISCGEDSGEWRLPDMVALCEVENDTVMRDLTKRSLLRKAGYEYVMTQSPDIRGIDVALMYSPFTFRIISHYALRVEPLPDMRPTRDILYVSGQLLSGDTLHVFVVHAPSRYGGERHTRPHRLRVAERLCASVDSIRQRCKSPAIIIAGDFNDYADSPTLTRITSRCNMSNISSNAEGSNGAKGSYKYNGEWNSIDHIIISSPLVPFLQGCRVHDTGFLLEDDNKYGGVKPRRTYTGYRYSGGYSDHLPVVARFRWN